MDVDGAMADALNGVYSPPTGSGQRQLDLVFILDCTGSMGSYIASATKNIELIVENILQSEKLASPESLRIGLIAYRDHPPQDNSYITRSFDFTSDVPTVQADLKSLYASGGGDGPEAVTAALKAALDLQWRPAASKMCVIIADAPPHGIGEYGDGFPEGSPDGEDPLQLTRAMASQGISVFVVACEPALSGYQFGTDFFRALTVISSATMVPLTTATLLSHVIVGSALEQMDMERLIDEVGLAVGERVHGGEASVDDVARELHEKLLLRNESTKQLVFDSIYRDSEESRHNVDVFVNSGDLATAKTGLKKIVGSRFTQKYLDTRYSSYGGRTSSYYPSIPPRPSSTSVAAAAASMEGRSGWSTSPPSSPPRKVVREFKPFASSAKMSMASTPMGGGDSDPTGGAAHEVMSTDDEMTQSVELRFQSISLEQAKRITIASAWRTAPPRA